MSAAPGPSEPTDEALMSRAQDGEVAAFARLYDRHGARALRVAQAICRDRGRAEEVVQDGFLAIWRKRAGYRPELGSFKAWSTQIVQRQAIDSNRHTAVRPQLQPEAGAEQGTASGEPSASPLEHVVERSEGRKLRDSLRGLPDVQAEVIVLAFFGELSHAEIAAQLDLPRGTVKGRMRLGLEKLRAQIGQPGGARADDDRPLPGRSAG